MTVLLLPSNLVSLRHIGKAFNDFWVGASNKVIDFCVPKALPIDS